MNRFVKSRSLLFHLVAWFFVASLFLDGANVDDLLPGSGVLHDDDEVLAMTANADEGSYAPPLETDQQQGPSTIASHSEPSQRTSIRLIIDQDSPSLAADDIGYTSTQLPLFEGSPAALPETQRSGELLHIRYRSLLI